jgi:transcriptional regulator with XRE-family HTH domain
MTRADFTKSFRNSMQRSQRDPAAEFGTDQATVSRIERGAEPSRPLRRLLEALVARSRHRATSIVTHDGTVLISDRDIGVVSATSREEGEAEIQRRKVGLPKAGGINRPWHDEARRLRGEGAAMKTLARQFGVSVARVWQVTRGVCCPIDHRGDASRRNIRLALQARAAGRRPSWKPAQDAYLKEHYHCDRSAAEIGRDLGVSRNAVIGRAHRLGLARPA